MNKQIIPFTYESTEIRTINDNDKIFFCGKDVATALGYKDPINAIKQHTRGVAFHHPITDALGRTQEARFITEGDLYRLIISSKLPTAQKFEAWVFDEVLPSIRKHGGYMTGQEHMTPEEMALASMRWLKSKINEQAAQLEAQAPKVLFADSVSASNNTILVGELAKILRGNGIHIGQNRLFEWLRDNGYLIRRHGSDWNMPTQYAMDMNLFAIKETAVTHSDGHITVNKTPKVTGKGQQFFINKIMKEQES